MSTATSPEVVEAARIIEQLTGVPPTIRERKMTRKEKQEQVARVKRFLALAPTLQEGALQYAERIRQSYRLVR